MGHPTIYPTGVTIYNPEKCWNGLTIFQAQEVGAVLMDMNGREHNVWKGVHGFPNKIFPGGYLVTSRGRRTGKNHGRLLCARHGAKIFVRQYPCALP